MQASLSRAMGLGEWLLSGPQSPCLSSQGIDVEGG